MAMTAAQKKAAQRARDARDGWTTVTVRVAVEQVEELRRIAATLPPPSPLVDPRQMSLIGDMSPQ